MKNALASNTPATGLRMKTLALALATAFGATPVWATAPVTLTVGLGGDASDTTGCTSPSNTTCTLRGALSTANDGDTIIFASSLSNGTIIFTSDDAASVGIFPGPTALVIGGKSVSMDASSLAQPLTLSGNDARRLFYIAADGGLTLKNINLTLGKAQGYDGGIGGGGGGGGAGLGGAILSAGTLTLNSVTLFANNVAGGKGGDGGGGAIVSGGGGGGTAGAGGTGEGGAGGGANGGSVDNAGGSGSFGGGGGGGGGSGGNGGSGGAGGFGGGGGGGGSGEGGATSGGTGGWGGGAGGGGGGNSGGGGGAAGLGGALFVKAGSVTLKNTTFDSNSTTAGADGLGGVPGAGNAYGGGIFVCTSTEDGANCSAILDEAASCGNSFASNTADTDQADLYWSGATGGAHATTGLTDICKTPPIMGDVPDQTPTVGVAITPVTLPDYVTLTEGDAITSYAIASGALPPGLGLNTGSGAITGTPTTAGTYNITVTASDDAGASNADAVSFTVGIGSQTITFNALADKTWGDAPFALNASASSGLAVIFTSQTPGSCSVTGGNTVTLQAIGTCTIRASQGGDSNYEEAANVERSFAILAPASAALPANDGETSTGSGVVTVTGSAPGAPSWGKFQFIPLSGNSDSPPAGSAPTGYDFPDGLFDFTVNGMAPGGTLVLNVTWPQPIPAGAVYWKYGPTSGNNTPHWYQFPVSYSPDRRTVTLTITDGGLGDDDLSQNGTIVDQNGPSQPMVATPIPAVGAWELLVLSGLLGMAGLWARRQC